MGVVDTVADTGVDTVADTGVDTGVDIVADTGVDIAEASATAPSAFAGEVAMQQELSAARQ